MRRGFPLFQSKYVRNNNIRQMLQLVLSDPELLRSEAKLRPYLEELCKGSDLDDQVFLKTEADKQKEFMQSIEGVIQVISQATGAPPEQLMQIVRPRSNSKGARPRATLPGQQPGAPPPQPTEAAA